MRPLLVSIFLLIWASALTSAARAEDYPDRLVPDGATIEPVLSENARGTAIRLAAKGEPRGTVLMLPGAGLSSLIYTETPDGRTGWAQQFAQAGYEVLAYNGPRLRVHGAVHDTPGRVWGVGQIWQRWGLGDTYPFPYDNTRFPVAHMEAFLDSLPEVAGRKGTDQETRQNGQASHGKQPGKRADRVQTANLRALMQSNCPCIVLAHSAAGASVVQLLKTQPEFFSALVLLEPVGILSDPAELGLLPSSLPVLALYGDRIDERRQTGRFEAVRQFVEGMETSGQMIQLTEQGMSGNTHLYMIDDNSADVANIVLDWLANH